MMPLPYSDTVMEHFRHPRNVGRIEEADAKAMEGSPACGDMVAVYIKVDDQTHKIEDIKFESYGCASNIATGSIITEMAKGKTLEEAKHITWQEASDE
jgi:nitrogen fixation NifU-like protein